MYVYTFFIIRNSMHEEQPSAFVCKMSDYDHLKNPKRGHKRNKCAIKLFQPARMLTRFLLHSNDLLPPLDL